MQLSVLGPLEVRRGDEVIEIRRGIPRVLLCALIVNRAETVAADTLIERLWGDALPANPNNALQTHIAYLRKALGGASQAPIATRASGYVLDVDPDGVDIHRFERLVEDGVRLVESGTAPSLAEAIGMFEDASRLWRGRPLEDVADRPFAIGEATRLEELRLLAAQRHVDALLSLGRSDDAARHLAGLVREQPLRERFHEQLVLALYRSGRQAEALRSYEIARRVLADELGLDPGPELRRIERLVLDQSLELDWVRPAGFDRLPAPTVEDDAVATTPPLIGREGELLRIDDLLRRTRLLTLTGPGGCGKTRLALEVATRAAARRPVNFVDLGLVAADADVATTVAAELGVEVPPAPEVADGLAQALSGSDALVVLDTCEHVLAGAAAVAAALLRTCPRVTVLATSRRPLGVDGELAWPVPPLRLPLADEDPREAGAVQLFMERATAVAPDLVLDDRALADIAEVCRALDGLPLAIELAAAQVDVLPPASIRARLADRFALLVAGSDRPAPRQRTLLSTIEWSVQLLDQTERDLLARLAVFVGSFDLDGAAAVSTDDRPLALKSLLELVRSSLVTPAGDDRYRLLDTVRAYALENLTDRTRLDDMRRRHAEHMTAVAEVAFSNARNPAQTSWLARARADLGNIRAALEWCFSPSGDACLGARLAGFVAWIWTLDGLLVEASRALDRAAAVDDAPPDVRARVMLGIGLLAAPLGELGRAREASQASADIALAGGHPALGADAMITLGVTQWALGELDDAAATHDTAIRLFDEAGDRWAATVARVVRARTALEAGDVGLAEAILDAALDDAWATGDAHVIGLAFDQHSRLAFAAGDLARAATAARECLAQNESIGYAEGICSALHVLGQVRRCEGALAAARALHLRALAVASRIRHTGAICETLEDLAAVSVVEGDDERAAVLLLHAARVRERRVLPLRRREAESVTALADDVRSRLGPTWDGMAKLVPLTSLDALIDDVLGRTRQATSA